MTVTRGIGEADLPITDPDHIPVLCSEVVEALAPREDAIIVDGTFGAGGYSQAILKTAPCVVIAIDRDPEAKRRAAALAEFYKDRLTFMAGRFGDMAELLDNAGIERVDGVTLDLGISSMQIDDASRGFSFLRDGPLDMRMDQSGRNAADVVNTLPEGDLADLIYTYGEERHARRIAKAIITARVERPFSRTVHLADVIRASIRRAQDGIDPATRTFQALRIYVNDELGELERGLAAAEGLLKPGGRLAVVSFHSLEDRIVKRFLKERSEAKARPSRHLPTQEDPKETATFTLISKRAIRPTKAEVRSNVRARSARLRIAERTAVPAIRSAPMTAEVRP